MYNPHIYTKTVVQCINMLIEIKVQIVLYIRLRQLAKLQNPSDSHDIVDKTKLCNKKAVNVMLCMKFVATQCFS